MVSALINSDAFDGDLFLHRDNIIITSLAGECRSNPASNSLNGGNVSSKEGPALSNNLHGCACSFDLVLDSRGRCVAKWVALKTVCDPADWCGQGRLRGVLDSTDPNEKIAYITSNKFTGKLAVSFNNFFLNEPWSSSDEGAAKNNEGTGTKNSLIIRDPAGKISDYIGYPVQFQVENTGVNTCQGKFVDILCRKSSLPIEKIVVPEKIEQQKPRTGSHAASHKSAAIKLNYQRTFRNESKTSTAASSADLVVDETTLGRRQTPAKTQKKKVF